MLTGAIWIILGISLIDAGDSTAIASTLLVLAPANLRAGVWIATGSLAVVAAWRPCWIKSDGWAWLGLYLQPALRAIALLQAYGDSLVGWAGGPGYPHGLAQGLVYVVVIAYIMVIAGWPETNDGKAK